MYQNNGQPQQWAPQQQQQMQPQQQQQPQWQPQQQPLAPSQILPPAPGWGPGQQQQQPRAPPPMQQQQWAPQQQMQMQPQQQQWAGAPPSNLPMRVGMAVPALPTQAEVMAEYQRQREQMAEVQRRREQGGVRVLEFPGPDGNKKSFKNAPAGFFSEKLIFLLPVRATGGLPWEIEESHFFKSQANPQGDSVLCLGKDVCPVCISRNYLFRSGSAADAELAKTWKKRTSYLMSVIDLSIHGSQHIDQSGEVVPFLWRAGQTAYMSIFEKLQAKGIARFMSMDPVQDPANGQVIYPRPLSVKKKKTGAREMDVDYVVDDVEGFNINPHYKTVYKHLRPLTELLVRDSAQAYAGALQSMSFPMTNEAVAALNALAAQDAAESAAKAQQAGVQQQQMQGAPQQQFAPQGQPQQLPPASTQQQWAPQQPQQQQQQQQWQQPQQQQQQMQTQQQWAPSLANQIRG